MEIVEAVPIKGRDYRWRATIRWGEKAAAIRLCNCRGGHNNEEEAMDCEHAKKRLTEVRGRTQ